MRSNRGIFWYSLGLTLLLLLPMVLTVAFFTDQYQKQQLLRQASAADSTLHIEPGAQGVYTLLLVVQQEEPAFVLARADGPQQTVTLCALPGSLRVSAPSGTTTLAECALSAGAGRAAQLLVGTVATGETAAPALHYIAATPATWADCAGRTASARIDTASLLDAAARTRLGYGEDPIADWEEHNRDLKARSKYLNDLHLRELRYHSANGTDFKVGLIPTAEFHAGRDKTMQGVVYDPNMPTEEVFTSPDRRTAEGIVYATKPLSYQGQLIENFSVRFEKGRAVEVKAEKGQDVLEQIISMDEGCHYLGECALVPKESPIHQSGLLFYNTLFDENAACHLALGFGFDECVKGFENMTKEELYEIGVNDAGNHTDFMIGSDDLSIDGVDEHGNVHPIFRNGTWAF